MPTAKNKLHKAIVEKAGGTGSQDIYFRTNSLLYVDTFGTTVGIALPPDSEKMNPPVPIRLLCRAGLLYRCYVTLAGTSTDASQNVSVLVPNSKFSAFVAWAVAGTNTLPGYGKVAIAGGIRMNRVTLQ